MRIGPLHRDGFTNVSNIESERMFNDLTLEQFRLYVGLRIEAQYAEPGERRDKFGRTFMLDVGETLFGLEGLAERYGMSTDAVRRAIATFERLGFGVRRPAIEVASPSATPGGSSPATRRGKEAATPPSIFRFTTDRARCWNVEEAATPPPGSTATGAATPHAVAAATIQPATQNPTRQLSSYDGAASASPSKSVAMKGHDNEVLAGGRSREPDRPDRLERLRADVLRALGLGSPTETIRLEIPRDEVKAAALDAILARIEAGGAENMQRAVRRCANYARDKEREGGVVRTLHMFTDRLGEFVPRPPSPMAEPRSPSARQEPARPVLTHEVDHDVAFVPKARAPRADGLRQVDGARLRRARIEAGITSQDELARRIGASAATISEAEVHGRASARTMERIARALGVSVADLGGVDP